jgi:hypothetical protein
MALSAETRRRVLGLALLGFGGLMLVVGLTVLAPRLRGATFLVYWLGCMGLTGLAALTALLDLWATSRRVRQAQQELVSRTIDDFSQAKRRAQGRALSSGLSEPAADASIPPVSGRKAQSP